MNNLRAAIPFFIKSERRSGTYYFINETEQAIAYDFDADENTARNSSKDRNLATILGLQSGAQISGATATDTRIAILVRFNQTTKVYILDRNWNRVSSEDFDLPVSTNYQAICATNNRWVIPNITNRRLEFRTFAGVEQTSERQSVTTFIVTGIFSDGTYIYLINNANNRVYRRTFTSTTITEFIRNLGTGSWFGGAATSTRFVIYDDTGDDAHFYNHSGAVQSSEELSVTSGLYAAVIAIED